MLYSIKKYKERDIKIPTNSSNYTPIKSKLVVERMKTGRRERKNLSLSFLFFVLCVQKIHFTSLE